MNFYSYSLLLTGSWFINTIYIFLVKNYWAAQKPTQKHEHASSQGYDTAQPEGANGLTTCQLVAPHTEGGITQRGTAPHGTGRMPARAPLGTGQWKQSVWFRVLIYACNPSQANTQRQKAGQWLPRLGWGGGWWEQKQKVTVKVYSVSLADIKNVLNFDCGDSCTILWLY